MSNNQDNGNVMAMRTALVEALNKVNDAYDILSKSCVTLEEVRQDIIEYFKKDYFNENQKRLC